MRASGTIGVGARVALRFLGARHVGTVHAIRSGYVSVRMDRRGRSRFGCSTIKHVDDVELLPAGRQLSSAELRELAYEADERALPLEAEAWRCEAEARDERETGS